MSAGGGKRHVLALFDLHLIAAGRNAQAGRRKVSAVNRERKIRIVSGRKLNRAHNSAGIGRNRHANLLVGRKSAHIECDLGSGLAGFHIRARTDHCIAVIV